MPNYWDDLDRLLAGGTTTGDPMVESRLGTVGGAAIGPAAPRPKRTQYHVKGALKSIFPQITKGSAGLYEMVGRAIPGEDYFERIGKAASAQADIWMANDPDVREFQKSIESGEESLLTEALGAVGPTLHAASISVMPFVGRPIAAAYFYRLNEREVYDMARSQGATHENARNMAVVGGAINSLLDMVGIGAATKTLRGRTFGKLLTTMAAASVTEGVTEGTQGVVAEVASEYANKPPEETTGQFFQRMYNKKGELWERWLHDSQVGGLMGFGVGGAGAVIGPIAQPATKPPPPVKPWAGHRPWEGPPEVIEEVPPEDITGIFNVPETGPIPKLLMEGEESQEAKQQKVRDHLMKTDPEFRARQREIDRLERNLELQRRSWERAAERGREPSEGLEKAVAETETQLRTAAEEHDKIINDMIKWGEEEAAKERAAAEEERARLDAAAAAIHKAEERAEFDRAMGEQVPFERVYDQAVADIMARQLEGREGATVPPAGREHVDKTDLARAMRTVIAEDEARAEAERAVAAATERGDVVGTTPEGDTVIVPEIEDEEVEGMIEQQRAIEERAVAEELEAIRQAEVYETEETTGPVAEEEEVAPPPPSKAERLEMLVRAGEKRKKAAEAEKNARQLYYDQVEHHYGDVFEGTDAEEDTILDSEGKPRFMLGGDLRSRQAVDAEIARPAIGWEESISGPGGITKKDAVLMILKADPAVLPHIEHGVKLHGKQQMRDAIVNGFNSAMLRLKRENPAAMQRAMLNIKRIAPVIERYIGRLSGGVRWQFGKLLKGEMGIATPVPQPTERGGRWVLNAKALFDKTDDFRKAGFLLPDGTWLDFGKDKFMGTEGYQLHEYIAEAIYDDVALTGTDAVIAFLQETGAMRTWYIKGRGLNLDIIGTVSDAQKAALKDAMEWLKYTEEDVYLDVSAAGGEVISSRPVKWPATNEKLATMVSQAYGGKLPPPDSRDWHFMLDWGGKDTRIDNMMDLERGLQGMVEGWPDAPALHVTTTGGIPDHLEREMSAMDGEWRRKRPGAVFIPKYQQVLVFADNISSFEHAQAGVLHEYVGHFGLRKTFGKSLDPILDKVWESYGDSVGMKEIIDTYYTNAETGEVLFDEGLVGDRRDAADEYLAKLAEEDPNLNLVQQAIAAVKKWLRDHGFTFANVQGMSDNDLRYLIMQSKRGLRQREAAPMPFGPEAVGVFPMAGAVPADPRISYMLPIIAKGDKVPQTIRDRIGAAPVTLRSRLDAALFGPRTAEEWDTRAYRFKSMVLDRLHPIKAQLGIFPYRLERLATGATSVLSTFLKHGKLRWDGPSLSVDTKLEGPLTWLHDNLGEDTSKFLHWMMAQRAVNLEAEEREFWLTEDVRNEIYEWAGRGPTDEEWVRLAAEFDEYNSSVLDVVEKAGLIDPVARTSWEQQYYIPFYRLLEDQEGRSGFLSAPQKSRKYISAQIRKLKGAEMRVGDPLENVLRNWSHMITESMRNVARAAAFDAGRRVVLADGRTPLVEQLSPADVMTFRSGKDKQGRRVTFVSRKTNDEVLVFQANGKPVYFKVNDHLLFNALSGMDSAKLDSWIVKLFTVPKRWLTYGATFGPAFRVANWARDTLHTAMIEKSFMPVIDSGIGFWKAFREYPEFIKFAASGASFGSSYIRADDPRAAAKYIKKVLAREGKGAYGRILNTPRKALDLWERIGEASENAARVQLYHNLSTKGGMPHFDAAFRGRDLLDFTMKGQSGIVQSLIQMVPFLNARMQGIYKIGRAGWENENEMRGAMLRAGIPLMVASLALWLINKEDQRYRELEDWDKWQYWHFWLGENHFRIPKPFELGAIFGATPEVIAQTAGGEEELPYALDFAQETLTETFKFFDIPQAFKPLAEVYFNKNLFTDRPIVSERLASLLPEEQKDPWTSETMQVFGDMLNISPKKLEHLINGYFAKVGVFGMMGADMITRAFHSFPEEPDKRVDDYPLVGRFVRQARAPRYTKYYSRFYDAVREYDQLVRTMHHYRNTGDAELAKEMVRKHNKILQYGPSLKKVREQLTKVNANVRLILHSDMTGEEKKEKVDRFLEIRNGLVQEAYKIVKDFL